MSAQSTGSSFVPIHGRLQEDFDSYTQFTYTPMDLYSIAGEDDAAIASFLQAAGKGNLQLLKRFAAKFNNGETLAETFVRVRDSEQMTALHFAACRGQIKVCKYLIEELKLDVNIEEGKGNTPLHSAVQRLQYSTAVYLLDVGANPNSANCIRRTPLHYAAEKGRKEFVKLLIERGAEIEAKALSGMGTPMNLSSAKGNKEALIALLNFRANGLADPHFTSPGIRTNLSTEADLFSAPLVIATIYNSVACIEALLQAGANPNFESHGTTPLYIAVIGRKIEAVKLLLKYGANANVPVELGITLLELTALDDRHTTCDRHKICEALFQVTNPIPYINDWTLNGVLNYVNSEEAIYQRAVKSMESFAKLKSMADASFKKKDYLDAAFGYSEALEKGLPDDAAVLSNRSLCWAKLNEGNQALTDAKACIKVKPDWFKGYYRAGVAYSLLKDYAKAADAFSDALKLDPRNKEIQAALREALTSQFSSSSDINN